MRALFVLTPTESKRLIGKAVANMKEVKTALTQGHMMIGHGSTNVYVLDEILGKRKFAGLMNPAAYLSGIITRGTLCATVGSEKPPVVLFKKGRVVPPPRTMAELLHDFGADSVFIKGANAVDAEGNAAVFMANPEGGTIGWAIGSILARGIRLIVPVGLEKLVPSVKESVGFCGQDTLDFCQGKRVGMLPLSNAKVVTEKEALKILTGVETHHIASGGVSGSEGSVVLAVEGSKEGVAKTIRLVDSIKGESSLHFRKGICETCEHFAPTQPDFDGSIYPKYCHYQGKKEEEIPPYLRNR